VDVGEYTIDHVQVDLRQVLSGTSRYVRNSKGLWTQGHENVRVNASEFAASAPLYIDANPHTGMEVYTADGFHFTDLILRTSTPTEGQPTGVGCTAGVRGFTLGWRRNGVEHGGLDGPRRGSHQIDSGDAAGLGASVYKRGCRAE
jgi:hypothetical protein